MTGTQALIQSRTSALPVRVSAIAEHFGIKLVDYAAFTRVYSVEKQELYDNVSRGGFSLVAEGRFVCVLNSALCHQPRRKWTAAHEIGHILSGHISGEPLVHSPGQEREADNFAAELLAPLTILHFCGVSSAMEIERLCGISREAASYRFQELTALRRRQDEIYRCGLRQPVSFSPDEIPEYTAPESVFLRRECDRELFMRFSPFIGSYITSRAAHDGYEQYLYRKSREPMAI